MMSDERGTVPGDMTAGAMVRREERAGNALGELKERCAVDAQRLEKMTRYTADRDRVNQLIGSARRAGSFSKLLKLSALVDLQEIKENKLYQILSSAPLESSSTGELLTVSTWADFCEHFIGRTSKHIDEQLRNLKEFGADALESMQRVGLGYREMRKLRQLSDDDRAVVLGEIEVNVGDKEAILELIESQAAKHARELAESRSQADRSSQELEASRKVTAEKDAKINDLSERLHLSESMKTDERADDLYRRLQEATRSALDGLMALLGAFNLIAEWDDAPQYLLDARGLCLATLYHRLIEFQSRFSIPDVKFTADDLSWMDVAGDRRPPVSVSDCLPPGADPGSTDAHASNAAEQRPAPDRSKGGTQP